VSRDVVFNSPEFLQYFRQVTPEGELGKLNIGSRPTRRKASDAGVGSLRAIPWIFAWMQTRHVLPSWLGVGEALAEVLPKREAELKAMAKEWPFFGSTLSLVEMTLAKADMHVAGCYDRVRFALLLVCALV
jgi:phosphoenolpyruvate carboxylase